VGRVLLSRWELDNLELALRLWHGGETALREMLPGEPIVYGGEIRKIADATSLEEVILLMKDTPYFTPLSLSMKLYKDKQSVFYLEVALERDYYKRLLDSVHRLGGSDAQRAERIVGSEIDMLNLSWLARLLEYHEVKFAEFHQFGIPGPGEISRKLVSAQGETSLEEITSEFLSRRIAGEAKVTQTLERISLLEDIIVQMSIDLATSLLAGYPFSITGVLAYYLLIRIELRNLRCVLVSKVHGEKEGEILSRLVGLR